MLCNIQHFLINNNKGINDKKLFEFKKIKPIYIPPYQYIPIYNTVTYKIETQNPIISQKFYNVVKNYMKEGSDLSNNKYNKPLPIVMPHTIKMYI
jgi:hypothetical protein